MRNLLFAAILLAACAKKTPPSLPIRDTAVREGKPSRECPQALWREGDLRPGGVVINNLSADSVLIFLDRCNGHTRVGEIGPGEADVFELPSGAVGFDGLLRFFTYRGPRKTPGIEMVSSVGDPYLRLTVPAEPRSDCPEIWVNGKRSDQPIATIPRDSIASVNYEVNPLPSGCSRILIRLK